jgi:ketosteroid isomerase-like protein
MMPRWIGGAIGAVLAAAAAAPAAQGGPGAAPDARLVVAALDSQYQAAVKANDAAAMGRILADDMILVTGNGTVVTRAQLLASATDKLATYTQQDPSQRTVRLYGDRTAVVTALLWLKGTRAGQAFDYKLWYSDTYVRTPTGWRYAFGQASLRLPDPK